MCFYTAGCIKKNTLITLILKSGQWTSQESPFVSLFNVFTPDSSFLRNEIINRQMVFSNDQFSEEEVTISFQNYHPGCSPFSSIIL